MSSAIKSSPKPKYALYQGCIVVRLTDEVIQIEGVTYRKCEYLTAHKSYLVTRNTKLTRSQQQAHIQLFDTENLSYSMFQVIDMYRIWAK